MKAELGASARVDQDASVKSRWLVVALSVLGLVYLATASWSVESVSRDAISVALPAWHLVDQGSMDLSDIPDRGAWALQGTDGARYSNRTPGIVGFAFIGYFVASPFVHGFEVWPSTLVAVMSVLTAVILVVATVRRIAPTAPLLVLVLVGLGTSLWAVAADELWPHGPAALTIAVALYALSFDRLELAGAALAIGILVRPPIAVIAAVVGLGLGFTRKSWQPLFRIGLPCLLAVVALLVYGNSLFGEWSPFALYGPVGNMGSSIEIGDWLSNVARSLFSPRYGLLIWSPWLVVALAGVPKGWSRLPDWVRWSAIAAPAYLLIHMALNRVSGGLPFNYRYSIAAVVVAMPALLAGLPRLTRSKVFVAALIVSGAMSIALQGSAAWLAECSGVGTSQPVCSLFGF